MIVAVFLPTRLPGGLDVSLASLQAQSHPPDLWLIADELLSERADAHIRLSDEAPCKVQSFKVPKRPGNWRNLAASYNRAIERCVEADVDLLISMQDYFWLPPDGIHRFVAMSLRLEGHLLTGLASLSAEPGPDEVVDPEGGFTVFAEPYDGHKPTEIAWADVRDHDPWGPGESDDGSYAQRNPVEFESNWAAIPRAVFETVRFSPEYDIGVAYENQDFAIKAGAEVGAEVWLDRANHAIGLPHKKYFPEVERTDWEHNNQALHESRWSP